MNTILSGVARPVTVALCSLLVAAGLVVAPAAPAQAAVSCRVIAPHMRADRTLDLLMSVNVRSYTGRPMAWTVKMRRYVELRGTFYHSVRFSPTRHAHRTTPMPKGWTVYQVDAGAFGTRCTSWRR